MIIFRLENQNGIGPYLSGAMGDIIQYTGNTRRPEPNEEEAFQKHPHITNSMNYGFSSLEQLMNWFSFRELRHLFRMGFKVVVLDSKESFVIESETQTGFYKTKTELVKTIESLSLLEDELLKEQDVQMETVG